MMSSNVLIPGAVVVVCLLIILRFRSVPEKASTKSLSIASPAEEEGAINLMTFLMNKNMTAILIKKPRAMA